MRDRRGRFIRGNTPVNLRDETTGRFTSRRDDEASRLTVDDKHKIVAAVIDSW